MPEEVQRQVQVMFEKAPDEVRGKARLGDLSFEMAPERIEQIRETVRDLAMEPWEELPDQARGEIPAHLQAVIESADAMIALTPTDNPNVHTEREQLEGRLEEEGNWFRGARQYARRAQFDRYLDERESSLPTGKAVQEARDELQEVQRELRELNQEIDTRRDAVSAIRQASGQSAGEDLTAIFTDRASALGDAAKTWFKALGAAVVVSLLGAVITFCALKPERGNHDPTDFAALGLGIFILGLLAFGVRVCAQNYRVNRHLEAVYNSKAAALGTFTRLVASIEEEEIRSAVSLTVAQSVFEPEETGFVDASGDHVTLVERALMPRVSGSGSTAPS